MRRFFLVFVLLVLSAWAPSAMAGNRPCDTAADCLSGWVCEYPVGDCARQNGNCEPAPTCGSISGLVCGCDQGTGQETYANACDATNQDVVIASVGACQVGSSCGGQTCSGDTFCQLPAGTCERYAPAQCPVFLFRAELYEESGVCVPYPASCGPENEPVCTCEGHAFPNACVAAQNFESVAREGSCSVGQLCGGFGGIPCSTPGEKCISRCPGCIPDGVGHCEVPPVTCDNSCVPACACDGTWYRNQCEWLLDQPLFLATPAQLRNVAGCDEVWAFHFSTKTETSWVGTSTAEGYNVYQAPLDGAGVPGPWSCIASGVPGAPFTLSAQPSSGQVWAYLLAKVEGGVEGPLGWGGTGCTPRVAANPCP